ncbi:MAG TPA: glycosyltransferase family 39 protein [Bryobacteraceae bacterium]|nr:glycosyltransferase family 39 protein [Bryobacteraceae bacterium]
MFQSFTASLRKSPVFDEAPHIASGLSYLETRVFHANLQHPPLLKEISALFLLADGIHWPKSPLADALIRGGPQGDKLEWPIGVNIIHDNGADRVLFWGRLPFVLLGGLLGWLIYWWGRELVGSTAALAGLFFYAFDPTMVAHSALVTTDVGVAAFTVLFLFTLWRYLHGPSRLRLIFCGLALGAVLGAKFSAVFLLPVAAILMAAAVRWPIATKSAAAGAPPEKSFAKAGPNSLCPCGSGRKYKKCHGAGAAPSRNVEQSIRTQELLRAAGAFLIIFVIAAVVIQALYLFNSDPFLYLTGLRKVNADHVAGYQAYLHGELSPHFLSYFAVVFLVKEPFATVGLSIAGLVLVLRRKAMPPMTKLFLLLTPVVLFLAVSTMADNLGIRYIIPVLPFAYLLAGLALAELLSHRARWGRYAAAALCLWVMVEAVGIYPDHLSYFNEAACLLTAPGRIGWDGGSACGTMWLDDSNVDWGQSVKQLRDWVDRNAQGRPLHLAYFGVYPPEDYGLQYVKTDMTQLVGKPAPGLYAVSAHIVARTPPAAAAAGMSAEWLRARPLAMVGHALYIYDVP